jgi:hypothetical protein
MLVLFYKELTRSARAETGDVDTTDGARVFARAAYVFNATQVHAAPPAARAPNSISPPTPLLPGCAP